MISMASMSQYQRTRMRAMALHGIPDRSGTDRWLPPDAAQTPPPAAGEVRVEVTASGARVLRID